MVTIHSVLKNNDLEFDVTHFKNEEFELFKYIDKYVKNIGASNRINYQINFDVDPEIKRFYKDKIKIKGNKDLLKMAFDVIVENAQRHAFINQSKQNKIEFS